MGDRASSVRVYTCARTGWSMGHRWRSENVGEPRYDRSTAPWIASMHLSDALTGFYGLARGPAAPSSFPGQGRGRAGCPHSLGGDADESAGSPGSMPDKRHHRVHARLTCPAAQEAVQPHRLGDVWLRRVPRRRAKQDGPLSCRPAGQAGTAANGELQPLGQPRRAQGARLRFASLRVSVAWIGTTRDSAHTARRGAEARSINRPRPGGTQAKLGSKTRAQDLRRGRQLGRPASAYSVILLFRLCIGYRPARLPVFGAVCAAVIQSLYAQGSRAPGPAAVRWRNRVGS